MTCNSDKAVLMWPWVLLALDDWGRGDASPRRLKAQLFPMLDSLTTTDIREALTSYTAAGLILLYDVDGKQYMAVPPVKWFRYQTHVRTDKRSNDDASHFPAPPEQADSGAKESVSRNRACLREDARISALPLTTPSPSPPPSPSPSLHPTPPPERAERSARPAGLGLLEKSVSILEAEGFSRQEVEAAAEDLRLNPPSTPIRSMVSVLRKVAIRRREEAASVSAVPPVDTEAEKQAKWEADQAERAEKRARARSLMTPEQKAEAAAILAAAEARNGGT